MTFLGHSIEAANHNKVVTFFGHSVQAVNRMYMSNNLTVDWGWCGFPSPSLSPSILTRWTPDLSTMSWMLWPFLPMILAEKQFNAHLLIIVIWACNSNSDCTRPVQWLKLAQMAVEHSGWMVDRRVNQQQNEKKNGTSASAGLQDANPTKRP